MTSKKESEPETPKRPQSAIDASGNHSRNEQSEERAKDQQSQEDHHRSERRRHIPAEVNRDSCDAGTTPMSISPPTTTHPPNQEGLICGNCSEAGHSLADCTYNIDEYGYLNGCPRCDTLSHNYADCPAPKFAHDDYFYLITKRHGKPPLRCRWDFRLGYWKRFKESVYQDDATAMRPQTPWFAKDRRDRGVVQMWNEIVLDPIWYGRTDWTTNVGKMVHPLDKEWVNPYNRKSVDLSGDGDGGYGGLGDGGREPEWKRGKRGADGVDEYGRLRREDFGEVSTNGGPVQEVCAGDGQSQSMSTRPPKPTIQPWSRNGRSQGDGQDGRSWKKRRLEDQRVEQLSHGHMFDQAETNNGNDQDRRYDNSQGWNHGFQQQVGIGSNNGSVSSPSPTPGQHPGNGFQTFPAQSQGPTQTAPPYVEQQRPPTFQDIQNPFPPIGPAQVPIGMTSREYGKYKAEEARRKLGPIPGWKPRNTQARNDNGNGNGHKKSWQNNGSGGFHRRDQGHHKADGRPHDQNHRDNLGHHGSRDLQNSQGFPQRNFDFRAGALPPAQPLGRPGVQINRPQAQTSRNSNTFNTQHSGFTPSQPVAEGPNSTRVAAIMAARVGGQKNADRKQGGKNAGGVGNQQFNRRHGHQQPGTDSEGYCVNCRSHGHVIEECEGNCGLCRAGGHKARACRFFGLGGR